MIKNAYQMYSYGPRPDKTPAFKGSPGIFNNWHYVYTSIPKDMESPG